MRRCARAAESPPYMPLKASTVIHTAVPIMKRFSVNEMKPSGTLLEPPTHAHLSSPPI